MIVVYFQMNDRDASYFERRALSRYQLAARGHRPTCR